MTTPTEHAYVASYDFDASAPRLGQTIRILGVPGEPWISCIVKNGPERSRLIAFLAEKGIKTETTDAHTWDPMEPGFRTRLGDVLEAVTGERHITATPDIKTPSREGQARHREKRVQFERFLRSEGIQYEVTCATQHSDTVCRILDLDASSADEAEEPHSGDEAWRKERLSYARRHGHETLPDPGDTPMGQEDDNPAPGIDY